MMIRDMTILFFTQTAAALFAVWRMTQWREAAKGWEGQAKKWRALAQGTQDREI